MSSLLRHGRLFFAVLSLLAIVSCSRSGDAVERAKVKLDFDDFRQALLTRHADRVISYLPQNVSDYLRQINAGDGVSTDAAEPGVTAAPGVTLLLRTVLHKKVPPEVRAHLDLETLLQRLGQRGLLDSREIRDVSLGRVTINGPRASAELYYRGDLLPLHVPFVRHAGIWKVGLLSMLPYAEVLMRLDRAVTGKSESQQVAEIVSPLPLL